MSIRAEMRSMEKNDNSLFLSNQRQIFLTKAEIQTSPETPILRETPVIEDNNQNEGLLFFSSGLVAIAIVGTLALIALMLKRMAFSKAIDNRLAKTKHNCQVSCENCQFFDNNPYLKCALHPSKVMSAEAKDCSDYSPRS
jgi:hypothetical protein